MGKRKSRKVVRWAKRARIASLDSDCDTLFNNNISNNNNNNEDVNDGTSNTNAVQVGQDDNIENKVDIIIKDNDNKCYRSVTISGAGLGVEKTIAVVETLKRHYIKQGTNYSQETSIKSADDNVPHLQVILTLLDT